MRNAKKALSVVVALVMLLSVLGIVGYAMPADTVCELTIKADKDSYAAGDEITLTFYAQTSADIPSVEMAGQYIIGYDSSAIEPYSTSANLPDHGFEGSSTQAAYFDNSMSQAVDNDTLLGMGTTISNGNAIAGYFIAENGDSFVASNAAPVEIFSVKMKVKADAADGDYEIAFNTDSFSDYNCYIVDSVNGGIYGDDASVYSATASTVWSFVPATIHVGASGPVVSFSKAQVKMTLNEGKTALAEVADPIQLRVTSTIADADWDTYFGNTVDKGTATTSAISSVGIVAYKGAAADFDEATAKALVTNGTAASNYTAAETTYIQKTADDADAFFGAIIKGSRADAFASDVTFLGFVKYYDADGNTQVAFYEAAVTKTITDTTVSDYITAMNA